MSLTKALKNWESFQTLLQRVLINPQLSEVKLKEPTNLVKYCTKLVLTSALLDTMDTKTDIESVQESVVE